VSHVLHETQRERGGRDVPTVILYGRVTLPAHHPLVDTFAKVGDGPELTWKFGA